LRLFSEARAFGGRVIERREDRNMEVKLFFAEYASFSKG